MKIAIASGKGGTGKTTVATNLARIASEDDTNITYIDCDVEEPNGHLFLKPNIDKVTDSTLPYPVVDNNLCISCGKCAEICQYKAIIMIGENPLVFEDMCHACGGCVLVCPANAITEKQRIIGVIEEGKSGGISFIHAKLKIGQVMTPPLIRQIKQRAPNEGLVILDAPPGTSCPFIETIREADFIVLVTEPTPFGLNDMKLTVEVLEKLMMPYGVFINRADLGTAETVNFCQRRSIPVLSSLPYDTRIAEAYSNGILAVDALPEMRTFFSTLLSQIIRRITS